MKQKCQIQMGVGQYENAATPLRTRMNSYQTPALSNEVYNFDLSQGSQKLSAIKLEICSFYSKTDITFLL